MFGAREREDCWYLGESSEVECGTVDSEMENIVGEGGEWGAHLQGVLGWCMNSKDRHQDQNPGEKSPYSKDGPSSELCGAQCGDRKQCCLGPRGSGPRVARYLLWRLCKPKELLDKPEEGKRCSKGTILMFMPIKKIRCKPIPTQLRNI